MNADRIIAIAIDCQDPEALSTFWRQALGTDDPAEVFVVLADPEDNEFCVLPRR